MASSISTWPDPALALPPGEGPEASRAQHWERVAARLLRLQEVAAELAPLTELGPIAEVAVDHGVNVVGAQLGALYVVDPAHECGRLVRAAGLPKQEQEGYRQIPIDRTTPLGEALMSGEPVYLETRAQYALRFPTSEARTRDVTPGEMALFCVPLRVGERTLGALVFGFGGERRAGPEERPYLELLAHHCVQALERGRLLSSLQHALRRAEEEATAERVAHERMARLERLTAALGGAATRRDVARATIEVGCATLGTLSGALYVVEANQRLVLLEQRGSTEDFYQPLRELPLDTPLPVGVVARSRRPLWIESLDDYRARWPDLAERVEAMDRSYVFGVAPLVSEGEVLGVLAFGFPGQQPVAEADRVFLSMLAHHCAQALDRATLRERERRYLERLRVLADSGELLASTADFDATLHNAVRLALPTLGDFAFLDVVEEGEVRRIAAAHDDPATEALLATTRWVRSERTDMNLCALSSGHTGVHPYIDDEWMQRVASSPQHLELLQAVNLCSMITVPLRSQGTLLGALTVCHGRSGRHHTEDEAELAEELALRVSQALQRASLYRSLQEARTRAEAAARQAEEASRLKDEFLAVVSHELRTPLNAILGWAALLSHDPEAELNRGLEVIERNARSQLRLIDDILDVSRITRGELRLDPRSLDLALLVADVLESVRPWAQAKGVTVSAPNPTAPLVLVGDPERLRQVIWNLLSNAVKFTPPGGTIRVRAEQRGARMTLVVSDTGQGIEKSFLPYVFDRFRQADGSSSRIHGGLGLGLSIVRYVVEMHGGSVVAESEGLGKGSTFTVTLPVRPFSTPVHHDSSPPSEDRLTPLPAPESGVLAGVRVLVVEDEDDARELIAVLLSSQGAIVSAVGSAQEALDALDSFNPAVIVSDIGMPTHDGYWLMEQVRARRPELPAIALTAFTRRQDVDRAMAVGFRHHVGKPVDPAHLVELVAGCVAASAALSSRS